MSSNGRLGVGIIERSHPFTWTKTADQVLAKGTVKRLQTRATSTSFVDLTRSFEAGVGVIFALLELVLLETDALFDRLFASN